MIQRGFHSDRKGRSFSLRRGVESMKGEGTDSGKSGTRTLADWSIRSSAESTEGCVGHQLKIVTEMVRESEPVWPSGKALGR